MEWRCCGQNYVINGDGFFISYLPPLLLDAVSPFDLLLVRFGVKKEEDLGMDETAIGFEDPEKSTTGMSHYILFGDHREDYEKIIHLGFDACVKYFKDHIDEMADSSDRPPQ